MASRALRRRASYRAINGHNRVRSRPWLRILLVVLATLTMVTSGASAATIFFYGENLPTLKSFKNHFQFQNTLIRARNGAVLYDMADLSKSGGRRVVVPLISTDGNNDYYRQNHEDWLVAPGGHGIPLICQQASIATEDATFYSNPGFDALSIIRAGVDNFTTGQIVSGASTITQQLVRAYMLSGEKSKQTLSRKAAEIVLAVELTQKYPKSQILYYYLNSVPYGNLSIGIEAAAQTYFHRPVWQLDLPQCALLAGLPEAPTLYNPVTSLPEAKNRMRYVLHLMHIHGYLPNPQNLSEHELLNSIMQSKEVRSFQFSPPRAVKHSPHFVQYAIDQLHSIPALQGKIYNGLDVYTTLDPTLQQAAEGVVKAQVSTLGAYHVTDGALVSMDLRPSCYGCVLTMVGSADYHSVAIHGQVNMAISPRQPGSSFKPFNYVYAFEHGLSPATTVVDAPISIPDPGNPENGGYYVPTNYDHLFHGPVTLRVALQNSLNIPAVKVEQYDATVGGSVYNTVAQQAMRQGIKSLMADNPHCCGWSLTLGGLEHGVRLVEETSAFGAFATPRGVTVPPVAIWKVYDRTTHKLLYDAQRDGPKPEIAFRDPAYAYLMTNVLSDDASRCTPSVCEFGTGSPLYLGRPAAAKTGTTNGFTDNWTVGYTPDIVTGVWVGNADNTPMVGTTGITGAAPIWHDFMLKAFDILKLPPKDFYEPSNVSSGSTCLLPGAYQSYSTFGYDLFVGVVPYCSVGSYNSSVPTAPSNTNSVPVAPAVPTAVTQPTLAPAPVLPPTPVPTAPQVLQPTVAPIQPAPTVGNSGLPPAVQQPTP